MVKKEITSRDNPAVKRFVQLSASRKARMEENAFVTEGVKLTWEAACAGYRMESLFMTKAAWERCGQLPAPVQDADYFYEISDAVAQKMAQSVHTQGVFGVFRLLDKEEQPVKISSNGKFLLLCSLQDPGNLGTILRTAAAFGVDGIFISKDCPDLYSPKVLRAAMGGIFRANVQIVEDMEQLARSLQRQGIAVYAAALHREAVALQSAGLSKGGCAVAVGNEGNGLPAAFIEACNGCIQIPMQEGSESLNAAMAAGIILWEMARQDRP